MLLPTMRQFFIFCWKAACISLTLGFLLASFSTFIAASTFSFISIFALAFPYLFVAYTTCCIFNLFINRRWAYGMLLLLPVAYFNFTNTFAVRTEAPWQSAKDSSTLRIMTWNVQTFTGSLRKKASKTSVQVTQDSMLALIHYYNPDVLCMQEYRNVENSPRRPAVKSGLDSLGYKYSYCSKDREGHYFRNKNVLVQEGVAIFSKYPITDSARLMINNSNDTEYLVYTDIHFNGKPVRIYTAHLQSFEMYGDTSQEKFEGENIYEITLKKRSDAQYKIQETELKHEQEVKIIRSEINKTSMPVIYCGDLNITPTSYNYRLLKGNNLQDAFLKKGSGIGKTFYKIGPTLRIDIILADTAFQVQQCATGKKKYSDHYPVVADVKFK